MPYRAAAPVRARAPAAAAAPTSVSGPSADAAGLARTAERRRDAAYRAAAAEVRFANDQSAARGRADDATAEAIASAAAAEPPLDPSPASSPVAVRTVSARAPAAPSRQTDFTPLLLAIPLLFGAAAVTHTRGGMRGRIRAFARRPAQTA